MASEKDIVSAIADHLGLSADDLDKSASLRDELNLGPIELNDLLTELSKKFDVIFDPEDTEELYSVGDLIVLVEDNMIE